MLWPIVSGILILIGIVGTVAPFLPGPPLALAGLLVYGFATGFAGFSGWVIGIFIALTVLTFLIDLFGPALGAAGRRASRPAMFGSVLGTVLGVFGPLGIVIGPLLGAFLGEFFLTGNPADASRVAGRVFLAFVIGTAVKLGIVFAMAGYFVYLLVT